MVRREDKACNRESGNLLSGKGELPMKADPEYSLGRESISLRIRVSAERISVLYEEPAAFGVQALFLRKIKSDERRREEIWYHLLEQDLEIRNF